MGNKPTSPKEEDSSHSKGSKGSNRSSSYKSANRRISVNIAKLEDDSDLSDVDVYILFYWLRNQIFKMFVRGLTQKHKNNQLPLI